MKKYAQHDEEDFLKSYFNEKGFVVEIGAADGITNSNSRMLIESGWGGLLIEPNIINFKKLESLYNQNNTVNCLNCGCSDEEGELTLFVDHNDEYHQISTFSEQQKINCISLYNCTFSEQKISVRKAMNLFEEFNINKIDFLSIDTETYDTKVIKGIDFEKVDIDLICVETLTSELLNYLEKFGYTIIKRGNNTFLSKKK
jgi:FkbM family methyltransferase